VGLSAAKAAPFRTLFYLFRRLNFWSCLKRGLNGTYISVEPFHLDRYVDEQVFRFNRRKEHDDAGRFKSVTKDFVGRHLILCRTEGESGLSRASLAFIGGSGGQRLRGRFDNLP
jgi:hypothetical protein